MKHILGSMLLILMMVLVGCGGGAPPSAVGTIPPQDNLPDQNKPASAETTVSPENTEDVPGEIKTFSIEPVGGWPLSDAVSTDTFKSYNLLSPYVGSASFWIRYVGGSAFSGEEKDARAAIELLGFSEYEFVSVDKLSYEMPIVRCIINTTIQGMKFTLGHYFIDAPGDQDLYFQLSTAPEDFSKAQPLWEEALKTVTVQ